MANYFGISSDSVSTLFSNLGSTKKNTQDLSPSSLSTYSSIKNGSYFKLAKSYYAKTDAKRPSETTAVSKENTKKLTAIKNSANDLKESTEVLLTKGTQSVFSKKQVKNEDGTSTYGYDKKAIFKAIKNFTEDYNAVVNSTKDAKATAVLSPASSMVKMTEANESLLLQAGITVKSDNTLQIDETLFNKADMTTVKSLFRDTGSYAYRVESKAYSIAQAASNEAKKSSTYTKNGTYSYNYASAFDDFY